MASGSNNISDGPADVVPIESFLGHESVLGIFCFLLFLRFFLFLGLLFFCELLLAFLNEFVYVLGQTVKLLVVHAAVEQVQFYL